MKNCKHMKTIQWEAGGYAITECIKCGKEISKIDYNKKKFFIIKFIKDMFYNINDWMWFTARDLTFPDKEKIPKKVVKE